ncbi:ribonuclease H-like domain-containing protein [Tanacetum coccineum]
MIRYVAMEMNIILEYIDNEVFFLQPHRRTGSDEKERRADTTANGCSKDHLRRFHGMDDAKEIWAAIKTRFGGNANSKKMQKAVLKQQFEAFTISTKESLEKGYDSMRTKTSKRHHLLPSSDNVAYLHKLKLFPSKHKQATAQEIAMTAIKIKKFYKKTGRRPRVDGKMHVAFDKRKVECFNCHNTGHFARECKFKGSKEGSRQEASRGQDFKPVRTEKEALMTIDEDSFNALQAKYDELQSEFGDQEAALVAHKLAVKKLESQLKASHKQQSSLNEKLNFQANQIFEKDEKLKKYRRIGMKALQLKLGFRHSIKSNAEVLGYEEEMSRGIFVLRETDEGYYDIPLYSRFKQVEYKGVPPPLSGDYTPRAQEDIDDSLYVYGKHRPQPQSLSPTVSNASSIVFSICPSNDSNEELGVVADASSTHYSTCQSNDSDGELGTITGTHSHVKTPRQPIRTPVTPSPIPSYKRQNWNQNLEDYQELSKVGSVTFGGSKGSISGKEKECFVVSSDFKMPDANQVLLKVPRQHNMYTFDMKNVASSKGYTCLLAKASSNEAKLWHRRRESNTRPPVRPRFDRYEPTPLTYLAYGFIGTNFCEE